MGAHLAPAGRVTPLQMVPDVPQPRLAAQGICKSYGGRIVLDDVSFAVQGGEIFGLLGPNGAGKSTLMRCLTGLTRADRGHLQLDGAPLSHAARAARARVGVVFQEPSLDPHLTARENLLLGAALFCVAPREARQRAAELLVFMELQDRGDELVRTFSGGMRRRLELARALIHRPAVLLLDEPTAGLDPVAFERTWQRLQALCAQQGLTLVLTTHRADEAARCHRLAVLDRGHMVACDTPDALLTRVAGDVIIIDADGPEAVAAHLEARLQVRAQIHNDQVLIEREAGHTWVPRLVECFEPGRLRGVSLRRPTLSDVFFHLTGRGLAGGDAVAAP